MAAAGSLGEGCLQVATRGPCLGTGDLSTGERPAFGAMEGGQGGGAEGFS